MQYVISFLASIYCLVLCGEAIHFYRTRSRTEEAGMLGDGFCIASGSIM